MGAAKTNVDAMIIKYVLLYGEDKGEWVEIKIESIPKLAEFIKVNYSALTKRLKLQEHFEFNEKTNLLKVLKGF